MSADIRHNHIGRLGRYGLVCALGAALSMPVMGQDDGVQSADGRITISVQDTDLSQVLELLSIQSQKNIITSKSVSATISANLYDVTFDEALDSILHVNGYVWDQQANFIYVYTKDEYDAIIKASRMVESRIFRLDYIGASDANEIITPLLSEEGQASHRGDVDAGVIIDPSDVGEDSWAFSSLLVVNDYIENLDSIAALLEELDVPPKQVLVESTILQASLDEANAFGIDFSIIGNMNFTDLTNPLSAVGNLLNGSDSDSGFQPDDNRAAAGTSTVGNTAGPAGLKIGIINDDTAFFLRVLDEVTDTTVLSRPRIMCLNRQRAEVLVGQRVGYLSTTATETSTTQTVEFLDTGIHLQFRPFISENNMVRLELAPSVSEASLRDVTDAQGVVVTIPDELTNEITANVRVMDGQTLVLGGLFRESNRVTRRQTPFLGDIPVLGYAFRGQDDQVDRDEIIFMVTPSVVHDEALWEMGNSILQQADDVLIGSRKGLLAFSRERQTSYNNIRALEAFNKGDSEKALYYANTSLRLSPTQPEVIHFRQQLIGTKEKAYERSMLNRALRKAIDN